MDQQPHTYNQSERPSESLTTLLHPETIAPGVPNVMSAAPGNRRSRWGLLLAAVLVLLVVLSGGVYAVLQHYKKKSPVAAGTASITLLYSDGKTVLWHFADGVHTDESAPDFAKFVQHELQLLYPANVLRGGDWRVVTTLDHTLQKEAETQYATHASTLKADGLINNALVAESAKTGAIVSWVNDSSDNSSVPTTLTQPESLAIPLTFAAVMNADSSVTVATTYDDTQGPLTGWSCINTGTCLYDYDRAYRGTITLAQALGDLRPVPTIRAAMAAGLIANGGHSSDIQTLNQLAGDNTAFACFLGSDKTRANEVPCGSAVFIGDAVYSSPLNMLAAYGTLANNGQLVAQTGITSVTHDGKRIYSASQDLKQVVPARVAQAVNGVLADPSVSTLKSTGKFTLQNNPVSIAVGRDDAGAKSSVIVYAKDYVVGMWATGDTSKASSTDRALAAAEAEGWLNKAVTKN